MLDLVGGQQRVPLQHERYDARRHGGRLRGARHDEPLGAVVKLWMGDRDRRVAPHLAQRVTARRHDVRLHEPLSGRPGRRERREPVIRRVVRRVAVGHRPHRDHIRHVAGDADRHRVRPAVAGRRHHDDARLPGTHDGLVQRVVPVVRPGRRAERQVQHPDAVGVLVGHDPVQPTDHVRVTALPVRVERLDRHQGRPGGDTAEPAATQDLAIGHDAHDVGTMAIAIRDRGPATVAVPDCVIHERHATVAVRVLQEPVVGPQAGVEHGDADPSPDGPLVVELARTDLGRVEHICRGRGAFPFLVPHTNVCTILE